MKKFLIIVILPLLALGFYFFFQYQNAMKGFESDKKVPVFIEYGTSVKNIVKTLKEKEIIKEEWPMLLYLKWYNKSDNLQAGDFILHPGTPISELTEILSNAQKQEIPIRILEGYTIEEIDDLLAKKGLIQKGEFIECTKNCKFPEYNFVYDGNLEGYLFPDTYFVSVNDFEVKSFIERLLKTFQKRFLTEENMAEYKKQERTLQEVVTMASLVEEEDRTETNRPIVAGILWKRKDQGIHLGVDASTRYYERNKTGALTREDFKKDNPYNLRRKLGLPPTAIASPSLSALNATLYPEKSKYYYYLHDKNGQIHYSVSNEEHNQKRFKYL